MDLSLNLIKDDSEFTFSNKMSNTVLSNFISVVLCNYKY